MLKDDAFYFNYIDMSSHFSTDPHTKLAAAIVRNPDDIIISGTNTFPHYIKPLPERLERPAKYTYIEHAERAAIYTAARHGDITLRSTMYTHCMPCVECARAIIMSGIGKVVCYYKPDTELIPNWIESCSKGHELLKEAGVEVVIRKDLWEAKIAKGK